MTIGSFLPWAEGRIGFLAVRFGGLDGAIDPAILATLGFALLMIARSRDFLDAPDGGRRWAPMIIGLVCFGVWLLGRQEAELMIAGWENDDGSGSIVPGFWFAGIGVILVAIVGSYASLRHREGETWSATSLIRLPRRSDLEPLGATLGGIAGAIAGGAAALAVFAPAAVGAALLFFAGIGFVVGAYAGRRLAAGLRGVLG